jgi:hypothetical protein
MQALASLAESDRKIALDRYRILRPHLATAKRGVVGRIVLSYSRKAYSEAVTRQDTETFRRLSPPGNAGWR